MKRTSSLILKALSIRNECAYCGRSLSYSDYGPSYATIDHIVPRSRGGTNGLQNLTLACLHCNRVKANRLWPHPSFNLKILFANKLIEEKTW